MLGGHNRAASLDSSPAQIGLLSVTLLWLAVMIVCARWEEPGNPYPWPGNPPSCSHATPLAPFPLGSPPQNVPVANAKPEDIQDLLGGALFKAIYKWMLESGPVYLLPTGGAGLRTWACLLACCPTRQRCLLCCKHQAGCRRLPEGGPHAASLAWLGC